MALSESLQQGLGSQAVVGCGVGADPEFTDSGPAAETCPSLSTSHPAHTPSVGCCFKTLFGVEMQMVEAQQAAGAQADGAHRRAHLHTLHAVLHWDTMAL